jgi:ribosomal protein L7Ae-like RNA K-turn-binding protein
MLGLCARAGKLVSGEEGVRIAVKRGQARLIIADFGVSENTRKRVTGLCSAANLPLIYQESAGDIIGRGGRMLIAVTDENFAKNLIELHENRTRGVL